jgi:hypothetical protein
VGRSAATFFSQTCHGYSGVSIYARKPRFRRPARRS